MKDLFEFYLTKLENTFLQKFKTCELNCYILIKTNFLNVEIVNGNKRHHTIGIFGVYLQLGQL